MLADLRLAARGLLRAKGLAAAAVLCLALGIAGTTIVYSVTSALVLHPVPAADATGLVMVAEVPPAQPSPDVKSFTRRAYGLLGLLEAHFEEEEQVLLPILDRTMSKEEFDKMYNQFHDRMMKNGGNG